MTHPDDSNWSAEKMKIIISKVEKWDCKKLQIFKLSCKQLCIEHIRFENLTTLFLDKIQILSAEGIHRIWMPNLSKLEISKYFTMKIKLKLPHYLRSERAFGHL